MSRFQKYQSLLVLCLLVFLGLLVGFLFWQKMGTMTWDEGAHALAGVGLSRYWFNLGKLKEFMGDYWASTGSFFFYPWGYTLFTSISYIVFGATDFAARLPNYVFGLMFIPAMYVLGKELFDRKVGLWAAFLAIFTPWILIWSRSALTDVPLTVLTVWAFAFLLKMMRENSLKYAILAGVCLGLTSQMKPPALVVFPIFILVPLVFWIHRQRKILKSQVVIFLIANLAAITISGSYFALGYLAPYLGEFGNHIAGNILHWVQFGNVYAEAEDPTWRQLYAWQYYLNFLPIQIGVPTLFISGLGGILLFLQRKYWPRLIFLSSVILVVYLAFVIVPNKDGRYTMQLVPFIIIPGAYAIAFFMNYFRNWRVILPIALLCWFMVQQVQVAYNSIWMGSTSVPIDLAVDSIVSSGKGGLVVVLGEDNGFNIQNVSFYMAAKDPDLLYGVYWADHLSEATWALSMVNQDIDGFKFIDMVTDTKSSRVVYIYERL